MNLNPDVEVQKHSVVLDKIAANSPGAALSANLATLTLEQPGTANYALKFKSLSDQTNSTSACAVFETVDEAKSFGLLVARLETRINEMEARQQAQGLLS
jgi:hypothetical protein